MSHVNFFLLEISVAVISVICILGYPLLMYSSQKKHEKWPLLRLLFWIFGILLASSALVGPLARISHEDFTAHMAGHLLLGMLAPLVLIFSKPMTLVLRALSVTSARKVSRLLNSGYGSFISNPVVAAVLNIGGLFLIYRTDVFLWMHESLLLFALVHLHVFLAGYLFTVSIIYIDVNPHRYSYLYRGAVLILALGFHKVLSKLIYASPPATVSESEGETGALVMYYGGDVIDVLLIIVLCYQWYRAGAPLPQRVM